MEFLITTAQMVLIILMSTVIIAVIAKPMRSAIDKLDQLPRRK